jgi:uncharacterized protein YutE (UPF0331/DUF86 family)
MNSINLNILADKVDRMVDCIDRLMAFQGHTFEQYVADEGYTQMAIERLLGMVIRSALSINSELLKQIAGINTVKNLESFEEVGKAGCISLELARKLSMSGGFSNVLAYQYDELVPELVFQNLQEVLVHYPDYIEAIQNYLDSLEATSNE